MGTNSLSVFHFVCGAHLAKLHILHKAYDALTYTPNSDADEKVTSKRYGTMVNICACTLDCWPESVKLFVRWQQQQQQQSNRLECERCIQNATNQHH